MRRITRDLVPTTLEQFGLVAAIEEFIHRLSDNLSLTVHFQCDAENIPRLAPKVELALYRIMQEPVSYTHLDVYKRQPMYSFFEHVNDEAIFVVH